VTPIFGVRSDSRVFSNFYDKFYSDVFFPTLITNNIKEIYQLGDLFDRRKYVNFYTLHECRKYFFDKAKEHGIHVHILLGNHDIFWRDSLSINSPDLLLKDYNNITLYDKPVTIELNKILVDIIPWICKENEEEILKFIKNSSSDICLGHFEISGFQMYKGIDSNEGLTPSLFKKYKKVLSGHYHHRSSNYNIHYVGTPCEHTWADYDDPRGFHIFDTDTLTLDFIQNPFNIFSKIYYDDTKDIGYSTEDFENKHLKLIVVNKTDYYKFDQFIEKIYKSNPLELKIIEDMSEFEADALGDEEVDLEDTVTLLSQYVDSLDTDADKDRIKTLMKTLYVEAQNLEE
jgi:DNA repair exonuclease SbcCD nuclease subunit